MDRFSRQIYGYCSVLLSISCIWMVQMYRPDHGNSKTVVHFASCYDSTTTESIEITLGFFYLKLYFHIDFNYFIMPMALLIAKKHLRRDFIVTSGIDYLWRGNQINHFIKHNWSAATWLHARMNRNFLFKTAKMFFASRSYVQTDPTTLMVDLSRLSLWLWILFWKLRL